MSEDRMQGIQRYLNNAITNYPLIARDDGDYVLYSDHLRALQKLRDALEELLDDDESDHSRCRADVCPHLKARAALREAK